MFPLINKGFALTRNVTRSSLLLTTTRYAVSSSHPASFVSRHLTTTPSTRARLSDAAKSLRDAEKQRRQAEQQVRKAKQLEAKRKEKEQAAKRKEKEREQAKKQREREREQKRKLKERELAKKRKEREQAQKASEKVTAEKRDAMRARKSSKLKPPKMLKSSWQLFLQDYMTQNKGGKSLVELSKDAAAKFHELPSDELARLAERVQKAKQEYPALYDAWKQSLTPDMIREENLRRAARRKLGLSVRRPLRFSDEPKRPMTAFFRFMQDVRNDPAKSHILNGEDSVPKQSRLVAAAWRELSPDEKRPYEEAAEKDKQQYQRERQAFEERHGIAKN